MSIFLFTFFGADGREFHFSSRLESFDQKYFFDIFVTF